MTRAAHASRMLAYYPGRAAAVEGEGSRVLRIRGSTGGVARDGGILTPEGWRTENYLANPVFLYAHDQSGLPIGRCVKLEHDKNGMVFDIEFAPREINEFADIVFRMYKSGFLNGSSVGFRVMPDGMRDPDDGERAAGAQWVSTEHELLELSAVPVGADPAALIESRSMFTAADIPMIRSFGLPAFRALAKEIEKMGKEQRIMPKERDGGIVALVRDEADFDAARGFHEAPWEHEGEHDITANVGVLKDGGELAVQGLRFGEGWDIEAATEWAGKEEHAEALDSWRMDAPVEDEEDEEPDDKEKDGDMRTLVARLLNVLDRVDQRLAAMEEREASEDDEEEEETPKGKEKDEDEARSIATAVASGPDSDTDPHGMMDLARSFAGK